MRLPGKEVCSVGNCSWFFWEPWQRCCCKNSQRLSRIHFLARLKLKKKFFLRSEARTVSGFLLCIGPAVFWDNLGISIWLLPSAGVCALHGTLSGLGRGLWYSLVMCHREGGVAGKWGHVVAVEGQWGGHCCSSGTRLSPLELCIPALTPQGRAHSWQPPYFKSMTLSHRRAMECCYSGCFMYWCNYIKVWIFGARE